MSNMYSVDIFGAFRTSISFVISGPFGVAKMLMKSEVVAHHLVALEAVIPIRSSTAEFAVVGDEKTFLDCSSLSCFVNFNLIECLSQNLVGSEKIDSCSGFGTHFPESSKRGIGGYYEHSKAPLKRGLIEGLENKEGVTDL